MPNSRGYVLLTSLYLLALLSISSVAAVQTSVLMAQHTRLLDSQVRSGLDTSDRLNAVEAVLLRGETLAEPDVSETHAACDSRAGTWIRVRRLHSRALHLVDTEGVSHEAQVIINMGFRPVRMAERAQRRAYQCFNRLYSRPKFHCPLTLYSAVSHGGKFGSRGAIRGCPLQPG